MIIKSLFNKHSTINWNTCSIPNTIERVIETTY